MEKCYQCGENDVAGKYETCGDCSYGMGIAHEQKAFTPKLAKYRRYLEAMQEDHSANAGYDKAIAYFEKVFGK